MRALMQTTWRQAYAHIYSPATLDDLFQGRLPQVGSWTAGRGAKLATLVAEQQEQIVGMASLCWRIDGDGELTQLYVSPSMQGKGIGLALWHRGLAILCEHGCAAVQVWVLARAAAVSFYVHRQAELFAEGSYRLGEHAERACGYRLRLH